MRLVSAFLLVALPACSVALGIEELPTATQDPAVESPECGTCVAEGCHAERAACLADRACSDLYPCIAACPKNDPACRSRCEQSNVAAATSAPFHALDACRRIQCTDECYGISGLARLIDPACDCADDQCAPFLRSCITSGQTTGETIGDCERRLACFAGRTVVDPDEVITCSATPLGGVDESFTVRFCWQGAACGSCPMAGGKELACKGKYSWPQPLADFVDYTFTVIDLKGRGIADVDVAACPSTDCESCKKPDATGKTDATGLVTLKVPTWAGGFHGCLQMSSADRLPALWYGGRPILRSERLMRYPLFSATELSDWAKVIGVTVDATRGQILVATRDCAFSPASGLVPDVPPGSGASVAYLIQGEPKAEGPTDSTGAAAIINVPAGSVDVVVRDGSGVEHGRTPVYVRGGAITGVYVFPSGSGI